jgi:hypothetical protein
MKKIKIPKNTRKKYVDCIDEYLCGRGKKDMSDISSKKQRTIMKKAINRIPSEGWMMILSELEIDHNRIPNHRLTPEVELAIKLCG